MKTFFFLAIFTIYGLLFSCTNCDNKNNQDENTNLNDTISINRNDTIDNMAREDSLAVEDSVNVNIYEVVEESNSELEDEKSPTVNVSRRGEKNTQTINDNFALQGNGIGVVRIGTDIRKLPSVAKGLYDRKKIAVTLTDLS